MVKGKAFNEKHESGAGVLSEREAQVSEITGSDMMITARVRTMETCLCGCGLRHGFVDNPSVTSFFIRANDAEPIEIEGGAFAAL